MDLLGPLNPRASTSETTAIPVLRLTMPCKMHPDVLLGPNSQLPSTSVGISSVVLDTPETVFESNNKQVRNPRHHESSS